MVIFLGLILKVFFISSNILIFYCFFELSLIPIILIILIWGYKPERLEASSFILIYTVIGAIPLLCGVVYLIFILGFYYLNSSYYLFFFFCSCRSISYFIIFFVFLIKLPIFGLQSWLPKAHVEAPIRGSIYLAAILLKIGVWGFYNFQKLLGGGFFSKKIILWYLIIWCLCSWPLVCLICILQNDIKSFIAYSSVCHMVFILARLVRLSSVGTLGLILMRVSHGFISSAMFYHFNLTYSFVHRRSVILKKGLILLLPLKALIWVLVVRKNFSIPPSLGFFSEVLMLTNILNKSKIFLCLMVFLSLFFIGLYKIYLIISVNKKNKKNVYFLIDKYFFVPFLLLILKFIFIFYF